MCGIIGCVSTDNVMPRLLKGLENLEYRGYDSSGVAFFENEKIKRIRSAGKVLFLQEKTEKIKGDSFCGIGHTRWATHGEPTEKNAHPHKSKNGKFYVVHNGIIENAEEIKKTLLLENDTFESQTDTEVFAHLVEKYYQGEPVSAIAKALAVLKGSYAFGILCEDFPDVIFASSSGSPLIVSEGENGNCIASDAVAIEQKNRVFRLSNGEICKITKSTVDFFDPSGEKIVKNEEIGYEKETGADKGEYQHFMLKEIYEQPEAVKKTVESFVKLGSINFPDVVLDEEYIKNKLEKIIIVGCGSAYNAGLAGVGIFKKMCGISCFAEVASEFRYDEPFVDENTLAVFISQSGETADTIASLRFAKRCGARVISVVNVKSSTMSMESENVILTKAGREIAVATTKAYSAQIVSLYALGIYLGKVRKMITDKEENKYVEELMKLPFKIKEVLEVTSEEVKSLAKTLADKREAFFLGRLSDYATACEGALKLKEVSYINCQSYPAGEMKHGTISLIENDSYVFCVAGECKVFQKTMSNISEIHARGGRVIVVADKAKSDLVPDFAKVIYVSNTLPEFRSSLLHLPFQLLAYYTAFFKNCDIDKPRNLAKSVTVE